MNCRIPFVLAGMSQTPVSHQRVARSVSADNSPFRQACAHVSDCGSSRPSRPLSCGCGSSVGPARFPPFRKRRHPHGRRAATRGPLRRAGEISRRSRLRRTRHGPPVLRESARRPDRAFRRGRLNRRFADRRRGSPDSALRRRVLAGYGGLFRSLLDTRHVHRTRHPVRCGQRSSVLHVRPHVWGRFWIAA